MKNELANMLETKKGQRFTVEIINAESENDKLFSQLVVSYATDFWAGVWKELLAQRDEYSRVVEQYGTYDESGAIYEDTHIIATINNIDISNPTWPYLLWKLAGNIYDKVGSVLEQFWTYEAAQAVLNEFISSISENGYGGEMLVVLNQNNEVIGFTAYTVIPFEEGALLADKRFPYDQLVAVQSGQVENISLGQLLCREYAGRQTLGVFLDFAVSEKMRGAGIGSALFDARLLRVAQLGADVIVGRTIQSSVAQYKGNYLARGMKPIAYDPANTLKTICAVYIDEIQQRIGR